MAGRVLAPPNPLRGLASDAAYISSFVRQIDGPVLLVGHSCSGSRDAGELSAALSATASPPRFAATR